MLLKCSKRGGLHVAHDLSVRTLLDTTLFPSPRAPLIRRKSRGDYEFLRNVLLTPLIHGNGGRENERNYSFESQF
jgi:hypothetical protein